MKTKILVLCFLLILLTTACVSATRQPDSGSIVGEIVYNRVYNGTIDAWGGAKFLKPLLWGLFWVVLITAIFTTLGSFVNSLTMGFLSGLIFGVLVGIVAMFVVGSNVSKALPAKAEDQAIHAVKEGIDQAKYDRANVYLEELHVPVVAIYPPGQSKPEVKSCDESIDSSSNCAPYEWTEPCCPHDCNCQDVCDSYDSEGDCTSSHEKCDTCWRTRHVPYFAELWRYGIFVRMMSKLATPESGLSPFSEDGIALRYLSDWMVPQDYEDYWRSGKRCSLNSSEYTPPADWKRYYGMVSQRQVPLVNVPHKYVNWINAAEAQVYFENTKDIPLYEEAGLLPAMNPIYSRIGTGWKADYDFVQFVGGLTVSQTEYYRWQDVTSTFSTFFANSRQGSIVVVFAPKDKVESLGSVDAWVRTIKANFQQKDKWDEVVGSETLQRIMPKNLFVLACIVDVNTNMIPSNGCRIETGMPQGNEGIKDTFATGTDMALQGMFFTPEAFFGTVQVVYVPKEGSAFSDVALKRDGNKPADLLLRDDPNGLRRVSMKGFDYLQADIKLTAGEIDQLVAKEVQVQKGAARHAIWVAGLWLLGLVVMILLLFLLRASA